jgi:hypothetical protein
METGALTAPPRLLERLVFHVIPPAAREAVAGDLCELYQSPLQYLLSAAGTLPFVIASQIRRTANLPVLVLQGSIILLLLGGFCGNARAASLAGAAAVTVLLLFLSLLIGVYRSDEPPSAKRAVLEALIVAAGVLAYARGIMSGLHASHRLGSDQPAWLLFTWLILPFGTPVVGGLRAAMVLARERLHNPFACRMSVTDIANAYDDFAANVARRNRFDMVLLLGLTVLSALAALFFPLPRAVLGLTVLYPVAAVYLFFHGVAQPRPEKAEFASLREICRREIRRQSQLRSFLLWLLPVPFFASLSAGAPASALLAGVILILLCFLIWAGDRERNAHACSLMESLAQTRERRPA